MSLHQLANHMSARGRGPDSTLVHMSPREVEGLQKLAVANGTTLTINPQTGLPEAFSLESLLPTLLGGAATFFTGGAITPLMAALGTGAITALTSKDLGKGLMAGLGAYSGAGLVSGLAGFGAADIGEKAVSSAAADAAAEGLSNTAGSQADAYAAAMQKGVGDRMAGASYSDRLGAGLSKAMSDPMGAANAVGGGSTIAGLAKVAGALSPLLAGETGNTVQTVTKRPLPRPRQPSVYDNMSQTFERYAANGGLMGLAHGGAVRRFNGETGSAVTPAFTASSTYDPNANFMANTGPDERTLAYINERFGTNNTETKTANAGKGFAATPEAAAAPVATPTKQIETAPLAAAQVFPTELAANTTGNTAANTTGIAALSSAGTTMGNNNAVTKTNSAATTPLITDQVYDLFMNTLDRPPSESDMQYWATQFGINNKTIDPNEIADFKTAAAGEIAKRQADYNSAKNYIPISKLDDLYMQELSRHGEYGTGDKEGGMEFWKRTFGNYINPEELAGFRTEAAKERAAREAAKLPTVVTDLTTAAPIYLKEGVGGSTGAGQIGGGTVINPNGTITTSPRIPGIPVGGFTGMQNVRDTYEAGGGQLGYTSPTYTEKTFADKYKNTGSQKEMYDYLMGKGDKPTKTKNKDGTFRELSRSYNEAVLGVPGSTNKRLTWNKDKGEYERNRDYVHRTKVLDLDKNGKKQYEADGKTVKTTPITYMSTNAAKAALDKTKLTSTSGNSLAEWAIDNKVQEQSLADIFDIPLETVRSIFANYEASKKPAKNGGLMQLANGGMAYSYGGGVRSEYVNEAGETRVWDRSNGIYRPKTLVKDGKTYTWDTVIDNYKLAGAGAGITSLLDTSGDGPPAGGENSPNPNWDGMTAEQKAAFYDANPTFAAITKAGQKALDFIGITNPLEAAIANGRLGLSGYNNFGKESTIPSGGIVSPGQADRDYGKSSFGKSGSADQDIGAAPAPAAPTDTGSMDSNDVNDTGLLASGGMTGYAQGGLGSLGGYSDGGRLLRGPGDGVSDSIPASIGNRQPARLADGEFVVPARIVSELGNGSTEAGARALYKMMDRIQANRRKTTGKNSVAVDSKAHKYLPA